MSSISIEISKIRVGLRHLRLDPPVRFDVGSDGEYFYVISNKYGIEVKSSDLQEIIDGAVEQLRRKVLENGRN
jgi:hypothetical protein